MATCDHPPCTCTVERDGETCGVNCEIASSGDPCTCTHGECTTSVAAALGTYGDSSTFPNEGDQRDEHEATLDDHL